MNMTGNVHITQ